MRADQPRVLNRVELVGRVSGDPVLRTMPSGEELTTFRLVVPRGNGVLVDTIDMACWSAAARRRAARLADGDQVHAVGALRRRFLSTGTGAAASRFEVEVESLMLNR